MSRFGRRGSEFAAVAGVGLLIAVTAAMNVAATPSRASSRWNHVGAPSGQYVTTGVGEGGLEPLIVGPVWKTLQLTERYSPRFTFVDVAPKGDSPGDYGVFHDPIVLKGVRVGTIDAQCISAYADQCSGSIRIPGRGQITFAGITPLGSDPDHYAITGGTGVFARVGGALVINFPDVNSARLTLKLTR